MTTGATTDYIFDRADDRRELDRLRAIEAVFDPATRRRLAAAGAGPGARVLEVGPGAGSIMTWLCDQVGPTGHVTALELNPRFVAAVTRDNLTVVRGDVGLLSPEAGPFDLIHARYVLVHIADAARALDRMIACVRPGGWIVIEEPDFSAACALAGAPADRAGFDAVARACVHMFAAAGKDGALGARLHAWFGARGLVELAAERDAPVAPGGSALASMMAMSTAHLRAAYLATGLASDGDVDGYLRLAGDAASSAIYYATVSLSGRRPL
jgi:SAM-dependent methyltransferase